jgi:hypothetical protein
LSNFNNCLQKPRAQPCLTLTNRLTAKGFIPCITLTNKSLSQGSHHVKL